MENKVLWARTPAVLRSVLEQDQALVDKILPTVDANVRSAYP